MFGNVYRSRKFTSKEKVGCWLKIKKQRHHALLLQLHNNVDRKGGEERKIFFSCNPAGSEEEKTLTKIANP
jgi:hypothetical protein